MKIYTSLFEELTSVERLFDSWLEFKKGKAGRRDVQEFERHLEKNIFGLYRNLRAGNYIHDKYRSFDIHDPKLRHVSKACVRDRLVHQTVYTTLIRIYDSRLINDVYSSRIGKGTHKAIKKLRQFTWEVGHNFTCECWSLKCDVKRFYDSIDHDILFSLIQKTIKDEQSLSLIRSIIDSFHVDGMEGKGMPIGNLTSQIFANIYLNELDQFVKHTLRVKYYLRFADDLLFLSNDKREIWVLIPKIQRFLSERLKLILHPDKIIIRPISQGIDFLGYVVLPHHVVLRTATKRRMFRKLRLKQAEFFNEQLSGISLTQSLQSYLGILSHADAHKMSEGLKNTYASFRLPT